MKLYEIAAGIRALEEMDSEAFGQALEDLGGAFEDKAEDIAKYVREIEAEMGAYQGEISRLQEAVRSRANKMVWLKNYLKANMETIGLKEVGQLIKVKLQASPPSCQVSDDNEIPEGYKERLEMWKVDAKSIIKHWKETGEQVPGAIVSQSNHIRIYP